MLVLDDFLGAWRLSRRIEDRLGRPGRFEGTAALEPDGAGLRYREEGLLTLGDGPSLAAHRAYLWRTDGNGIAVLFADGRPFHRFVPEGRAQGTDHPCGRDLYRVAYDFAAWPHWSATWTVTGPAKDYAMTSAYRRLRPGEASATTPGLGAKGGPSNGPRDDGNGLAGPRRGRQPG